MNDDKILPFPGRGESKEELYRSVILAILKEAHSQVTEIQDYVVAAQKEIDTGTCPGWRKRELEEKMMIFSGATLALLPLVALIAVTGLTANTEKEPNGKTEE
jgi:hypothetical protein